LPTKKQWLYTKDQPLWQFVANSFSNIYDFAKIIIVANPAEVKLMSTFVEYPIVNGGNSREESLKNAISLIDTPYVMVSDVARCCLDKDIILDLIDKKEPNSCVVPAIKVPDTVYFENKPIDREKLLRVQTPQLSHTETLKEILDTQKGFTDESSAFYNNNKKVIFIEGSQKALKLTYKDDLKLLNCLKAPINSPKSGYGIDIHPFENNKPMVLCGVNIDLPFGFKAHSDGDVAIHSIIDALLGASSLGDIGELFPDTDNRYKNADSKKLLKEVSTLVKGVGYEIVNIDITILAQVPKISPYKEQMRTTLADILQIKRNQINIKATTGEKLGFVGRKEGVTVHAIATLNYYNWSDK